MPIVLFDSLPHDARVWMFASDRALSETEAATLLGETDRFLAQWKAHGAPLRCARRWTDDHFLAIAVDPTLEQASGCSIDGLFRAFQSLERTLETRLVAGGRLFYRDSRGAVHAASRDDVADLAARGILTADTRVFDTSLTTAGELRERFEQPAGATWVASLMPGRQASQPSSRSATKSSSVRNG